MGVEMGLPLKLSELLKGHWMRLLPMQKNEAIW